MRLLPENSLVSKSDFDKNFEKLAPYIKKLNTISKDPTYKDFESSINLPFDENHVKEAKEMADKMATGKLKYFIDIGIGGSSLGTKAVYDALFGYFDVLEPTRAPKMVFMDTNDASFTYKLLALLKHLEDPREVIINVVSKSGKTLEVLANLEVIQDNFPELKQRLVVTTLKNSTLWETSDEMKISNLLPLPEKIGGRFSVFSPVGLFPLACAGVDIFKLLEGAMEGREQGLRNDLSSNFSAVSAIATFVNYQNGKTINDTFLFHPEFESLGKWYRQLMGESLGKDGKGITPTVSIGSSDLHSMGQLYLGGPKDKFFTLVWAKPKNTVTISNDIDFGDKELLKNKSITQIMHAIYTSVKEMFVEHKIPLLEIDLENTSEKGIGYFLQFKMVEMMYLGKLMGVNTFDQPDVESYKTRTKEILSKGQ